MKKLFIVVMALAFLVAVGADCYAGGVKVPNLKNIKYLDGNGEVNDPVTIVKRVRYGKEGLSELKISSGEVVIWDMVSHDGVTVSAVIAGVEGFGSNVINYNHGFAGVAVTDLLTQDVGGSGDTSDDNYGYIAVQGYCLASVDAAITVTPATCGLAIAYQGRGAFASITGGYNTADVATLLQSSSAAGKYPVWVR